MDAAQQAPSCQLNMGRAMQFVQEVQARFQASRPELFKRFLQVITDGYGPGKELKPAEEAAPPIHEKMKGIFKDDLDLLEKFETFLPGNLAVEPSGHTANELAPELDAEPVD